MHLIQSRSLSQLPLGKRWGKLWCKQVADLSPRDKLGKHAPNSVILKCISPKKHLYYLAVLQNLFPSSLKYIFPGYQNILKKLDYPLRFPGNEAKMRNWIDFVKIESEMRHRICLWAKHLESQSYAQ